MSTGRRRTGKTHRHERRHRRRGGGGDGVPPPRGPDPDADLLGRIERGEHVVALTLLMRRHGTAVYRYCREELHDDALAADVHQQIFIQAYRALPGFAGRSTLRTWLFAIARHRVLDAVKSRRRAAAHLEDDETADMPDPTPSPGERIDDASLVCALLCCLRELDDDVRSVVLLRYEHGFTFEELAAMLDDKAGTLQARVTRVLPVLRRCIERRTKGRV